MVNFEKQSSCPDLLNPFLNRVYLPINIDAISAAENKMI